MVFIQSANDFQKPPFWAKKKLFLPVKKSSALFFSSKISHTKNLFCLYPGEEVFVF